MSGSLRVMPGTTFRNGMPPSGGYVYKGDDMETPQEIAYRNRQQVRAKRSADGRCPDCGYLLTARGHLVLCEVSG